MKNRALAVVLTVAIFAGIAVCFLRPIPAPNNPDFGGANRVFNQDPTALKMVEGSDLFDVFYRGMSSQSFPSALISIIPKHKSKTYTAGSASWEKNNMAQEGKSDVELWSNNGGEWEQICSYIAPPAYGMIENLEPDENNNYIEISPVGGSLPFSKRLFPSAERERGYDTGLVFPIVCYPGKIRVTIYVRECVPDGQDGKTVLYSSVGEAIPVTFEMENKRTSKPFDVASVDLVNEKYLNRIRRFITLRICPNDEDLELPYLDTAATLLERLRWFSYVEIPLNAYDYETTEENRYYKQPGLFVYGSKNDDAAYAFYMVPGINLDDLPKGYYRLTLHFCENEDGSGEQYTLTLKLRFGE